MRDQAEGQDVEFTEYFASFARRISRRWLRVHLQWRVSTYANDNACGPVAA